MLKLESILTESQWQTVPIDSNSLSRYNYSLLVPAKPIHTMDKELDFEFEFEDVGLANWVLLCVKSIPYNVYKINFTQENQNLQKYQNPLVTNLFATEMEDKPIHFGVDDNLRIFAPEFFIFGDNKKPIIGTKSHILSLTIELGQQVTFL